jgi:hypothetical protein
MSQREQMIAIATAEIGYIEGPAENHTKFQKANVPWCGAFVNWVAKQAGVKIPNCTYTPAGAVAFMDKKKWQDAAVATPEPGDIVFFDFPGDALDRISHVGIVVKDNGDGTVTTIEGNTAPDKKGDQRNGGEVCRKIRAYKAKNRGKLKPSLAVAIVGCSKCGGQEEVMNQVQAEKSNILAEKNRTDSLYQQTLRQVDEMMSVLSALEAEEGIVKTLGPERGESTTDFRKRMEDIARKMNDKTAMIRKQAEEVSALKNKLTATEKKLAAVSQKADSLSRLVGEQQQEIIALRQQLASSRKMVDSLKSKLAEKDQIINSKVKELNSAYYVIGKRDDLMTKGIIDKQGQVLFFGGRISVKQNFDAKDFTKIDISSLKELKIAAPKDRTSLVSNHDADTFELVAASDTECLLKIKDEKAFWKNAKYLVVMTE